jgi:hypothetical protein
MLIRDGNSNAEWQALRAALGRREARFVLRESLPTGTMGWDSEHLPRVLVSRDLYESVERVIPRAFADYVLAPVRARGAA